MVGSTLTLLSLSELLEELRKSNIVLGRDKEKMSSEMSSNYHKPSSESYVLILLFSNTTCF